MGDEVNESKVLKEELSANPWLAAKLGRGIRLVDWGAVAGGVL